MDRQLLLPFLTGSAMPSIICRPSATKEEASKRTMQPDLDQLVNEFYINGFVVLEDLVQRGGKFGHSTDANGVDMIMDNRRKTIFRFSGPKVIRSLELTIVETNEWNPDGLTMYWRPMAKVESALRAAGFSSVEFRPFVLPIDLPFPGYDEDVVTYTRKDEHGERMAFRGVLFQPWCHLIARK